MWNWWTNSRRQNLIREPLAHTIEKAAMTGAWQWQYVPKEIQEKAIQWMKVFVAERHWEGCAGFQLKDTTAWSIASQAAMMTLKYPDWYFENIPSFLIYPDTYIAPRTVQELGNGLQIVSDSMRQGEAWYRGPVVLNWKDIHASGIDHNHGHHLVIHELSHQMDMINSRSADGVPPLPETSQSELWKRRMQEEFNMARDYVAHGHRILVNDYGLTSHGEFFAVTSELYFQLPHELQEFHPGVFDLLMEFYQYDWREWIPQSPQ